MVWVVLHCNWVIGIEEKQRSPHECFVGMRLSDARSGCLFPMHELCARERVSGRETRNKRGGRGDGNICHNLQDRTLNTRLGLDVVDTGYSLYFKVAISGWKVTEKEMSLR